MSRYDYIEIDALCSQCNEACKCGVNPITRCAESDCCQAECYEEGMPGHTITARELEN